MRFGKLSGVFLIGVVVAAAGCSQKPQEAFKELKAAALGKDARAIWSRLTPETKVEVGRLAGEFFREREAAGGDFEYSPESPETYEYFEGLVAGLDELSVGYIRSLAIAKTSRREGSATIELSSFRLRPPKRPLKFEMSDRRWLWDARGELKSYLEYSKTGALEGF